MSENYGEPGHIKFSQDEWERASDLCRVLLEALGPQKQGCCETCNPPQVLFSNYRMRYVLARALREERATVKAA